MRCVFCGTTKDLVISRLPDKGLCDDCWQEMLAGWVFATGAKITMPDAECDHFHAEDGKEIANEVEEFFKKP